MKKNWNAFVWIFDGGGGRGRGIKTSSRHYGLKITSFHVSWSIFIFGLFFFFLLFFAHIDTFDGVLNLCCLTIRFCLFTKNNFYNHKVNYSACYYKKKKNILFLSPTSWPLLSHYQWYIESGSPSKDGLCTFESNREVTLPNLIIFLN